MKEKNVEMTEWDMMQEMVEMLEMEYREEAEVKTFQEEELMTNNNGVVLKIHGNEFQITIVKTE